MAKKGVYKISGNNKPKVLEKTIYNIEEWYPDTPSSERNPAKVTWELFIQDGNSFRSTNIKKKGVNHFTFGKNAYKNTYRVEGYIHRTEGKEPMSIIVQPQKNDSQPEAKEKDILGVSLTYQDGTKITKTLSYKDRLRATARCQGLEGQKIIFKLWEDDKAGNGHNKENEFITKSNSIEVNKYGKAYWDFSLSPTFISLATKNENENKKHEYYVTAEYNAKHEASNNVNVTNPEYHPPAPAPTPPKPKPKPKPKAESPKVSTNPQSSNNQKGKEGKITSMRLLDKNGIAFSKIPRFGDKIQLIIEGKNLVGEPYTLKLWEHDLSGANDLLYNQQHQFKSDEQRVDIVLRDEYRKIGEIGNNPKDPDSGEYWTGYHQEIFAEVIFLKKTSTSQTIDVGLQEESKPQTQNERSPGIIKEQPKAQNNSTCICKEQYKDLVWGGKVSCEFRKKVVQICSELWGESRKMEMANGLMAVMKVETDGTFKAHQIMGKSLKDVNSVTKDDFWLKTIDKKTGKEKKTSRAVGLIQFTQAALVKIGEFTNGSGFDKLHEVKLKFAKMGEIKQLDYVKKYFEPDKSRIKTPEDIYLLVFAPVGVGKSDTTTLYIKGTEEYRQNKSVDTDNNEIITRKEILERYKTSMKDGSQNLNKVKNFSCSNKSVSPTNPAPAPKVTDKNMLSKYLSYEQAIKSDTAKKYKLDNTPTAAEIENLRHLGKNIYDKIYEKFNGNVKLTSVFRSEKVNKKVGGSSTSQHRYGQALDIQGTNGITNKSIFKYVKDNLDYHQIIWEYGSTSEPNWVHVGYKPSGNKKINTRAKRVNGKTVYVTFDLKI